MSIKNYIRRNIYRWHRTTSLIVALPLLLWTVSGFLHPVFNSSKPDVKNQSLPAISIDSRKIKLSLQQALEMHAIDSIRNFRIVNLYGAPYYQVQYPGKDTCSYISCFNGQLLLNGDQQYVSFLAQRYMSEPNKGKKEDEHHGVPADLRDIILARMKMVHGRTVNISDVQLITEFNSEYKKSNLLLPVYRVQFERKDNIRLYIDAATGKMALAVDDKKAWFTKFFALTHTWSFLDGMGEGKHIALGIFSLMSFITAILGFCVYNITSLKKTRKTYEQRNRRLHRSLGNFFVLTTLLYSISGAWHSFYKLDEKDERGRQVSSVFHKSQLGFDLASLSKTLDTTQKMTDLSVVRMNDNLYWQLSVKDGKRSWKKYFDASTGKELKDGDAVYAGFLASRFNGSSSAAVFTKGIYAFDHQYSMMNKRLPVVEVGFAGKKSYYIETGTGTLAAVADPMDRAERFSFSNLHMHHYWEMWLGSEKGKPYKNLVLASSTLGLLVLAFTGLTIYWIRRQKKIKRAANSQ